MLKKTIFFLSEESSSNFAISAPGTSSSWDFRVLGFIAAHFSIEAYNALTMGGGGLGATTLKRVGPSNVGREQVEERRVRTATILAKVFVIWSSLQRNRPRPHY